MAKKRTRRLAAIMFTDIVGYTQMMQSDEKITLQLVDRHRSVLEELTSKYKGEVVQYFGDGSLSIYGSAVEAVKCALEMQQAFQQEPKVPLRIGLHVGDIAYGGGDIFGDGVNIASRLETLGVPGAIMISEKVYDDIKNHDEIQAKSMGAFEFKNTEHPLEVYALTNEGLAVPTEEDMKKGKLKASKETPLGKGLAKWGIPLLLLIALVFFIPQSSKWIRKQLGFAVSSDKALIVIEPFKILNDGIDTTMVVGLVDELRNGLSNTMNFSVIGSNTSEYIAEMGIASVREKTKADYLIEGSVRKQNGRLVVQSSITDLKTVQTEGLGRNEVFPDSILLLAPEIAIQAAEKLDIQLSQEQKQKLRLSPTDSLRARELYVKSEYYISRIRMDTAIILLTEAISIDSNYAEAYARRAYYLMESASFAGTNKAAEVLLNADNDIEKAIALNKNLPDPYYSRAFASMMFNWDFEAAEQDFQKAAELTPPNRRKGTNYGWFLGLVMGEWEEALKLQQREYELDPANIITQLEYTGPLFFTGRKKQAYDICNNLLEQTPESPFSYVAYLFHFIEGQYDESMENARKFDEFSFPGQVPLTLYMEGMISAKKGERENALTVIDKINEYELNGTPGLWGHAFARGIIYALLGDKEKALQQLRISQGNRETTFITIKSMTPYLLYNIADEPEFKAILEEMGLD